MLANRSIPVSLAVAFLLVHPAWTSAETKSALGARNRTAAVRFAGGEASASGSHHFAFLVKQHAPAVAALLQESVIYLDSSNFVRIGISTASNIAPLDFEGQLAVPPSLIEDPTSPLSLRVKSLQAAIDEIVDVIRQGESVSNEMRLRAESEIRALAVRVDRRDVNGRVFLKKIGRFVRSTASLSAATRNRLMGGGGDAPSFAGGTAGDLIRFVIDERLAPAIGSQASIHLSQIAQSLCDADRLAENQARKDAEEKAKSKARILEARQQAKRAAAATARRNVATATDYPYGNNLNVSPPYRYWGYSTPTYYYYYRSPRVITTYRYVISR